MTTFRLVQCVFLLVTTLLTNYVACYNMDAFENAIRQIANDSRYLFDYTTHIESVIKTEPDYFNYNFIKSAHVNFNCSFTGTYDWVLANARTVHQLRPKDIEVVAGMGDSISAGCGVNAYTPVGLLLEYRGRTWSMGGQSKLEDIFTVPNILKKFNPRLKGYNKFKDVSTVTKKKGVGLNAAISGSVASDLPAQAKDLVEQFNSLGYANKWKMVTVFVGGNDLCDSCNKPAEFTAERYADNLRQALDILHASMPRTLVNVVQSINVTDLKDMNNGLVCSLLHASLCPCAAYPKNQQASQDLDRLIQGYYDRTRELVNSGRYDTRDDFTVVLQPFLEEFAPPRLANGAIDFSYLAPDCFHFAIKGHALASLGLWNNMMQPVGKKARNVFLTDQPVCPTAQNPYIFTSKNSN